MVGRGGWQGLIGTFLNGFFLPGIFLTVFDSIRVPLPPFRFAGTGIGVVIVET